MSRMLKVFACGLEQDEVTRAAAVRTVECYPAFVVVEVADGAAGGIPAGRLVEDITAAYDLGPVRPTGRGPDRHLVQFVGPVKADWLAQVAGTGSVVLAHHRGFAVEVRAEPAVVDQLVRLGPVRQVLSVGADDQTRSAGPGPTAGPAGPGVTAEHPDTPLPAGTASLLRERLRREHRITRPSAALLEAVAVAGVSPPDGVHLLLRQNIQVLTGQYRRTVFGVAEAAGVASRPEPLRVVLAYAERPAGAEVTSLDLVVAGPDGTRATGVRAGSAVEVVEVSDPAPGCWTVDVVGANVPLGPQSFALVARGRLA